MNGLTGRIVLSDKDMLKREFPSVSRDELDVQWRESLDTYEQARTQKAEVDRVYMAAANELNRLERLMNKMKRRDMFAQR